MKENMDVSARNPKILYINHETVASGATVHRDEFTHAALALGANLKIHRHANVHVPVGSGSGTGWKTTRQSLKEKFYRKWTELSLMMITLKHGLAELRSIRHSRPDVVLVNYTAHISSVLLGRVLGIPVVLQIHCPYYLHAEYTGEYLRLGFFWKWIERQAIDMASEVVVISELLRDYYVGLGFPREKFTVAPNGVDTSRFCPEISGNPIRKKLGMEDALIVGFVGILEYWAGIDRLLDLLPRLAALPDNLKVLVIGAGPTEGLLRRIVARNGFEDRVIFTGFVPHEEIPQYMAAFDIAVAPYARVELFYASPMKVIEYLAMGKPILTSNMGQAAELIRHGESGLLYEPDDFKGMLDLLGSLVRSRELREQLSCGAAARSRELSLTWESNAASILKVCRRASTHRNVGTILRQKRGDAAKRA